MSKSEAHEASKVKVLAQEADCAAPTRTHAHTRTHSGRVQEKERDGQRARHAGRQALTRIGRMIRQESLLRGGRRTRRRRRRWKRRQALRRSLYMRLFLHPL